MRHNHERNRKFNKTVGISDRFRHIRNRAINYRKIIATCRNCIILRNQWSKNFPQFLGSRYKVIVPIYLLLLETQFCWDLQSSSHDWLDKDFHKISFICFYRSEYKFVWRTKVIWHCKLLDRWTWLFDLNANFTTHKGLWKLARFCCTFICLFSEISPDFS